MGRASALECWPYLNRVHTKSNPINGVSRQDFHGPWAAVTQAAVPLDMLTLMERDCTGYALLLLLPPTPTSSREKGGGGETWNF